MKTLTRLILILIICQFFAPMTFACETTIILSEAEYINLDKAVANVKKTKSGKVLSAETIDVEGEVVHVIKVLTKDGRVKKLRVHSSPSK